MNLSQRNSCARFFREMDNSVKRYEEINANSQTVTRKATPEESEYYSKLLESAKKEAEFYEKERRRLYGCVNKDKGNV